MEENVRLIKNKPASQLKNTYLRTLDPVNRFAYNAYQNQRQRCHNPRNRSYRDYGAKGIKVEYSRADFMKWVNANLKSASQDSFYGWSIGRIDHSRNYSLDNIEIQTVSNNSKERHIRLPYGHKNESSQRRTGIFHKVDNQCLATFKSIKDCADFVGVNTSTMNSNCNKKNPRGSVKYNWYFRFVADEFGTIIS